MLIIGLTGGIASGKTAVSNRFAELGVPVIDADVVARQVVQPGEPALDAVVQAFGAGILDDTGQLDRRALRQKVFSDPDAKGRLEAILHPRIRKRLQQDIKAATGPYAVLVIPLLVENRMQDMASRVLVVDVPESVQRSRVQHRDDATAEQAEAIMATQARRTDRLAAGDDILHNTGTLEDLTRGVDALHRKYLALAERDVEE